MGGVLPWFNRRSDASSFRMVEIRFGIVTRVRQCLFYFAWADLILNLFYKGDEHLAIVCMFTGNLKREYLLGLVIHSYMELDPPMPFPSPVSASPFSTIIDFYAGTVKGNNNSFF